MSSAASYNMVYWSRYWVSFGAASALLLGQNATAQQRSSAATAKEDRLKLVQIIVRCVCDGRVESPDGIFEPCRQPFTFEYMPCIFSTFAVQPYHRFLQH